MPIIQYLQQALKCMLQSSLAPSTRLCYLREGSLFIPFRPPGNSDMFPVYFLVIVTLAAFSSSAYALTSDDGGSLPEILTIKQRAEFEDRYHDVEQNN